MMCTAQAVLSKVAGLRLMRLEGINVKNIEVNIGYLLRSGAKLYYNGSNFVILGYVQDGSDVHAYSQYADIDE